MSHQVKDSQGSSLSQFLLISFLIAASPSKLSQHFHISRGFMAIAIACLHWGVQLAAKERVKDAGPESSTGEGIAGARDKADSCLETPIPQEQGRMRGWQRD